MANSGSGQKMYIACSRSLNMLGEVKMVYVLFCNYMANSGLG